MTPKTSTAISAIRSELQERLEVLNSEGKLLEANGWSSAPSTTWRCWVRWATATGWRTTPAWREEGTPPECLIDYFPDDWLLIVDESHVTCSQLQAMYNGDQARKNVLIEHGFRLPSAADNRPLKGRSSGRRPIKQCL